MKIVIVVILAIISFSASAEKVDEVRVYKSKHRMEFWTQGQLVKSFHVMLGRGGKAPKLRRGDNLVPEGSYILDYKNPDSQFHKSIHISYPNENDIRRANEAGVDPGGDIMIHGYPNRPKPLFKFLEKTGLIKFVNWTAGCVAVENNEMDEIYSELEVLTPIKIFH